MEKTELIISALQERMGQIVAAYETQIAILRAEITQLVDQQKAKEDYEKTLDAKLEEV